MSLRKLRAQREHDKRARAQLWPWGPRQGAHALIGWRRGWRLTLWVLRIVAHIDGVAIARLGPHARRPLPWRGAA